MFWKHSGKTQTALVTVITEIDIQYHGENLTQHFYFIKRLIYQGLCTSCYYCRRIMTHLLLDWFTLTSAGNTRTEAEWLGNGIRPPSPVKVQSGTMRQTGGGKLVNLYTSAYISAKFLQVILLSSFTKQFCFLIRTKLPSRMKAIQSSWQPGIISFYFQGAFIEQTNE